MEDLSAGTISLNTLSVLVVTAGIVLLLWGVVGRGMKAGPVTLPDIVLKWKRGVVLLLAFCFVVSGGFGFWYLNLRQPITLNVLTGLAHEEFVVFKEVIAQFEKDYKLKVIVENVSWEEALTKLAEERIDLVTFDINARHELVRRGLVEELSKKKYRGLIPSSVTPTLLEYLNVEGKRFFAPFRPNVQLVFLNKEKFIEAGIDPPTTWWQFKEVAKAFYERDNEARLVIQATDEVIALTMLQIIRSAGGSPDNLLHPQSKAALEFIRELCPYVLPKSYLVDWQTACGFLLSESVYSVRNWCFSLSLIHGAGRDVDFAVYSGLSWHEDSKPCNLLGGEFLALPKNARHKKEAVELMSFLMSKEVQTTLATKLGWPAIRMDIKEAPAWLLIHRRVTNAALAYAEPVPEYWLPEMPDIYRRLFHDIVSLDPDADIESTLEMFQLEINALVARP